MATGSGIDKPPPEWKATIGGMIKHGTLVKAWCDRCDARKRVDLQKLRAALGPDGSLIDRRPPCWTGCGGRVLFLASPGEATPFRPCVTIAGSQARMLRQWRAEQEARAAVNRAVGEAKGTKQEIDRLKALRNG